MGGRRCTGGKIPELEDKGLELDEEVKNWNELQKGLLLSKDIK